MNTPPEIMDLATANQVIRTLYRERTDAQAMAARYRAEADDLRRGLAMLSAEAELQGKALTELRQVLGKSAQDLEDSLPLAQPWSALRWNVLMVKNRLRAAEGGE